MLPTDSGEEANFVYDNMQRLRQLTHYRTDGTLADIADLSDDPRVVRFDYTVRADGRRTAANEFWYTAGSATQTSPLQASYQFTYDNLGRLTDEVFDHWDNSLDYRDRFAYDPAGNRVEKSRDAGRDGSVDARTAYRFDVNDRLIDELAYARESAPESRTTYTYDYTQNTGYSRERFVNGSSSTRPTLTHVYSYDLQGRLFTATVTNYNEAGTASSITRSTYDYGHNGIRVGAINEIDSNADGTFETRTKIEYLVDHQNHTGYQQVIRESHYDVATGKLVKTVDYTFGHDEISQTVVTYNSAGAEVSREKQWFLHDGKANVRGLLDAASAILTIAGIEQIYFYDAYGSLLNLQASQAATTLLYNGETFDTLTGNQYLRARYYNPANAQFNRLDPFFGNHQDPQSFNKYAYVHSDPINGLDPTGMWTVAGVLSGMAIGGLIGALVGGALGGIDSWLGGGSFLEGAAWGALFGFGIGATGGAIGAVIGTAGAASVWGVRVMLTINVLGTSWGTFDSLRNGHSWQAAFRLTTGLLGFTQVRAQIARWTPGLFKGAPSTGVAASEIDVVAALTHSDFGTWALRLSNRLGINFELINNPASRSRGGYNAAANRIRLNLAHHDSVDELVVTYIHEAIHAWGIRGTVLSEVIARIGSGRADSLSSAAYVTLLTIWQYGGRLPLLGHGEGGVLVSLFSLLDEQDR